ncbi:hypothetical protein [Pseudomonas sp. G3-19]
MSNKLREQFEAAYKDACLKRAIPRFDAAIFAKDHCGDYLNPLVQSAWWAWQECRAALVVELPPPYPEPDEPDDAIDDSYMDAYHAAQGMRHACSKAIEAAGLKVTP